VGNDLWELKLMTWRQKADNEEDWTSVIKGAKVHTEE
jgi:hypothetical protein